MNKHIQLGQRSLEVSTNARRDWSDFKVFKRSNCTHVVWGKLSLQYKSDYDCLDCKDEHEGCQECCDHEYDSSEGMMCINCDMEYPY